MIFRHYSEVTMSRFKELAELIAQHAETDGVHSTAIPRLTLVRMSGPTEPLHTVQSAALCIIAQGRKKVMLSDQIAQYEAGRHLLVSVDLPIVGQVFDATPQEPFLGLKLEMDLALLGELVIELGAAPPAPSPCMAMSVCNTCNELLDASLRLVKLLKTPGDIRILAPLIEREILYRLLNSDQAPALYQALNPSNRLHNVNRAISWIRENYRETLSIDELAARAYMSPSSLHEHFRTVTNMSPLQYQKQLRLQEARRLILTQALDAATAGRKVGYDSPSQFSREYRRQFGAPPLKDVSRLRAAPERFAEA